MPVVPNEPMHPDKIDQHLATCEDCFHLDAGRVLDKDYKPGKCPMLEALLEEWVNDLERRLACQ